MANPVPKSDTIFWRNVRRYVKRYRVPTKEARQACELMRHAGARPADVRLAEAMADCEMGPAPIRLAREGYWSDFRSPLDFPKVELVNMLKQSRRLKLAGRVEAGEFDD